MAAKKGKDIKDKNIKDEDIKKSSKVNGIKKDMEVEPPKQEPEEEKKPSLPKDATKDGMTAVKKRRKNDGKILLSGYFKSICSGTSPNVPLRDVPRCYRTVNAASAYLDQLALVHFEYCVRNINIQMLKEVREEKQVKVLLSVGGHGGNFQFLNSSGRVDTFYNSLFSYIYQPWGFDGVTFDIQQLDESNCSFVTEAIRRFKEFCIENGVEALISITALPTFVCPDASGITGIWNQLVPLINKLKEQNIIDLIQVMAYNYGHRYDPLIEKGVPVGQPKEMLKYMFNSYVKPFEINTGSTTVKYNGFDSDRIMLGVLASDKTGLTDFVRVDLVKEALKELNKEHKSGIGGAMVYNINYDAQKDYAFSRGLHSIGG